MTTALALACVVGWDMSGLDMPMAHWFGDRNGFALQRNWFMVNIAHEGARKLAWAIILFPTARRRDRAAGVKPAAPEAGKTVVTLVIGTVAWAVFAFWLHQVLFKVRPFG